MTSSRKLSALIEGVKDYIIGQSGYVPYIAKMYVVSIEQEGRYRIVAAFKSETEREGFIEMHPPHIRHNWRRTYKWCIFID